MRGGLAAHRRAERVQAGAARPTGRVSAARIGRDCSARACAGLACVGACVGRARTGAGAARSARAQASSRYFQNT
ncbi:hypothetical protein D0U02_02595 [Burkholderia pseudomallei]|uniref:Uncharacterized protein n=2 Tax=Burkholderia pseudomallei TaxID=28450 RepID=A0AAX0U6Q6_BURPE|nr:hypothetical protein BURPS1106A_A0967 [Burkholderia pseudomallei 1106a]ARL54019.1 hypothetical protein BOC51_30670 [Burkholderia pseudomallei]EES21778.1 hypothetical protein BURPS1106B_1020 [Burkholderia pseudomallei 1106b]RKN92748.1 hypothetical protein D8O03_28520 [Burkholderia mallei]AUL60069.1 hypothetical protein BHT10_30810 [Burkholderia pseudomallei]